MSKKKKHQSIRAYTSRHKCHSGPIEVTPGLFCGSENEIMSSLKSNSKGITTLVVLLTYSDVMRTREFMGEILYYPITDYSVLDDDVLEKLVGEIIEKTNAGKKLGMFCMGGHGRTGYVASAVLGKLGHDDPIAFLRQNYCQKAVESYEQVEHLAQFLNKPELVKTHAERICGNCGFRTEGYCLCRGVPVQAEFEGCLAFIDRDLL